MSTLTIRTTAEKHQRVRLMAEQQGRSVNALVDELLTIALTEHDAHARFVARTQKGDPARALEILNSIE